MAFYTAKGHILQCQTPHIEIQSTATGCATSLPLWNNTKQTSLKATAVKLPLHK